MNDKHYLKIVSTVDEQPEDSELVLRNITWTFG